MRRKAKHDAVKQSCKNLILWQLLNLAHHRCYRIFVGLKKAHKISQQTDVSKPLIRYSSAQSDRSSDATLM